MVTCRIIGEEIDFLLKSKVTIRINNTHHNSQDIIMGDMLDPSQTATLHSKEGT